MRKVIQLVIDPSAETIVATLYALCDDGSMWIKSFPLGKDKWRRIEGVPQDLEDETCIGSG